MERETETTQYCAWRCLLCVRQSVPREVWFIPREVESIPREVWSIPGEVGSISTVDCT